MYSHFVKLSLIILLCSKNVYAAEENLDKNEEIHTNKHSSTDKSSSHPEFRFRALGNALVRDSMQNNPDEIKMLQARITELEVIISEQKKLIELYKSENKYNSFNSRRHKLKD